MSFKIKQQRIGQISTLAASAFILVACGGGGGGSSDPVPKYVVPTPASTPDLLSYLKGDTYDLNWIGPYTLTQNQALQTVGASSTNNLLNGNYYQYVNSNGNCAIVNGKPFNGPCRNVGNTVYLAGSGSIQGLNASSLSAGTYNAVNADGSVSSTGTAAYYGMLTPQQYTPLGASANYRYYALPFVVTLHGPAYDSGILAYESLAYFMGTRHIAINVNSGSVSLTCKYSTTLTQGIGPDYSKPVIQLYGVPNGTGNLAPNNAQWVQRVLNVYDSRLTANANTIGYLYHAIWQYPSEPSCASLP